MMALDTMPLTMDYSMQMGFTSRTAKIDCLTDKGDRSVAFAGHLGLCCRQLWI